MAFGPAVTGQHRIYFVDTSYLLELYAVPGCFDPHAKEIVRSRFAEAWRRADRLFVPLGCLLEFGNHIADLRSPSDREKWAKLLHDRVVEALDPAAKQRQFAVVEAPLLTDLSLLVSDWRAKHVAAPRGLVDAATVEKARSEKRQRALGNPVHIWTRDRRLKGVEPDPEPDPFV